MHQSLDLIGKNSKHINIKMIIRFNRPCVLGKITDNKLSLSWTKPSNYTSYNIKIGK